MAHQDGSSVTPILRRLRKKDQYEFVLMTKWKDGKTDLITWLNLEDNMLNEISQTLCVAYI